MINIFNAAQIKEIDNCTIKNQDILSVDLMERASLAVYELLTRKLDINSIVYVFAGPGNNGGDALAIARMLSKDHYKLQVFLVNPDNRLSEDCSVNKERLEHLLPLRTISEKNDIPLIQPGSIVIDGLFGSGLNRPVEGLFSVIIEAINNSRSKVYSIDIPSGMFVEDNTDNNHSAVIKADEVFSFQFPKLSLLLPESAAYCKKLTLVDIGLCKKCIDSQDSSYNFTEKADITSLLMDRGLFSHKGDFGKAMIIAGSYGKMGAAVLAAKGCLRTGVGLLTMHIPRCGMDIMQTAVPEAMVDADESEKNVSHIREGIEEFTLGVGPGIGIGKETEHLLYFLLEVYKKPLVLDADAINLLGRNNALLKALPPKSILTPHPVEFERLTGTKYKNGYQRLQAARNFATEHDVHLVLKGAYSAIVAPGGAVYFNPTGNPGMATGGSGDVLTGIITSLLAQKYTPLNAALLGVYLHGYAGDMAAKSKSQRSMLASDITDYIGKSYKALEK